ncbi:MAG: SCP2 sterol-binding domain-containing protein [Acidimicrobiia bacterium]|nr:SCP2 sterol-binding domain-containing protein [bacterium]MXX00168.1 SCP2 sterol-binding domain-containing protein [Acidimicrobiia bacterium]MXX46079.1 SCP2 sterol-binding domain-containing protein [Acidimicrobiia bacterium]MXY73554.1 SCP2 sterol-binding domain-containing protein [Acidimicrobiia bacterium]MYB79389.1 SCP2 sterol-binding domain-containing protein [Acidimicrobiia bacterium]
MAVKFLSPEWLSEVTTALENHQGFQDAAREMELAIQFNVLDSPLGDTGYHLMITPQAITIALGIREDLDMTISQSYETAAAIMKGSLNVQSAFITGKIKVSGNLAKLMVHRNGIEQWLAAVSDIDVEY